MHLNGVGYMSAILASWSHPLFYNLSIGTVSEEERVQWGVCTRVEWTTCLLSQQAGHTPYFILHPQIQCQRKKEYNGEYALEWSGLNICLLFQQAGQTPYFILHHQVWCQSTTGSMCLKGVGYLSAILVSWSHPLFYILFIGMMSDEEGIQRGVCT